MQSLWSDADAEAAVARYAVSGIGRDVALRVYSSRLLGGDPRLVLHGGGNTSLKTSLPDLFGDPVDTLCVKGSGWDMAAIEPAGFSVLRLASLRQLRVRDALSDRDMLRLLRGARLDPDAPNPSVETLLHAFLPQKYIDHTHATAVLSLADQPDGAERCADLYGPRIGIVPYIMPGFGLAKTAAEVFATDPAVEALILLKHGVFSFADSAREAYERMIVTVSLAEERLQRGRKQVFVPATVPSSTASLAEVAPILRGACALPGERTGDYTRFVLDFRAGPSVINFVNGADLHAYALEGVATPDHTIRTKNYPLIAPAPESGRLDAFAAEVRAAVADFIAEYRDYFARNNPALAEPKRELDPAPRVILVPGLGLFGLGRTAKDAEIAADLAESWVQTVTDAEAIGSFESLTEEELFEIEYWPLEQAKLDAAQKPLTGHVALITGGAGTIGLAAARLMRDAGAEIVLLDRETANVEHVAAGFDGLGLACDVTDPAAVGAGFDRAVERFGGIDIVVSNAGAAWQGRIGEVDDKILRDSFELNFFAHQSVAQNAVRIMRAQETGGCLLFNVSRQAVSQGPNAGPYGLPKAASLFLMKQYALEYAADGIRSNAVNADGIRGGLLTPEFIAQRAAAYGMSEAEYMARNLLKREVAADDVAHAFLSLALARTTTGAFFPVDGGNLAAAPR